MTEHKPVTPQQQPKFAGIKTYMRLLHLQATQGIDFAVAGIPWDGATSYRTGQRLGPDAIRNDQRDVAEITALLAANVVYEFLSLIALNKN